MHQILFTIGAFPVRAYGLVVLVAIILGTQVAITLARIVAKPYEEHIVPAVYWSLLGALLGARIWQVFFFTPVYYANHPLQAIAIWDGGLSIQGGILGGLIVGIGYCRIKRISFWGFADLMAAPIALGQGIGRIACLLNGDAFGSPTGGHFGLVYPPGTVAYATYGSQPLWPAEVWEGQMDMVIFALLFSLMRRKLPRGYLFLMYNILYSAGRFGLEMLRGDSPRFLFHWTAAQWTSAVVILLAVVVMVRFGFRSPIVQTGKSE